jgi:hypothetical protein
VLWGVGGGGGGGGGALKSVAGKRAMPMRVLQSSFYEVEYEALCSKK